MNNNNNLEIELMAAKVNINEPLRTVCPFCGGGKSAESSFILTKFPDKSLYKCFRASCMASGYIFNSGYSPSKNQRKKKYKYLTSQLVSLDVTDCSYFKELYELEFIPSCWRRDKDNDRWAFPCYSFDGVQLGWVCRRTEKDGGKKVIGYWGNYEGPKYHVPEYYLGGNENILVIVEDIISATKVAQCTGTCSMALLGTNLNYGKVVEILTHDYKDVIIMLDPDATALSFKYKEKYSSIFNTLHVIPMEKDPKDTPRERLKELLNR